MLAGDQQVLDQTRGVDGLWHRGTPFGEDGYYIANGFDGVPLSHHVLTTDGILGRDTLGPVPGKPAAPPAGPWPEHLDKDATIAPPWFGNLHLVPTTELGGRRRVPRVARQIARKIGTPTAYG